MKRMLLGLVFVVGGMSSSYASWNALVDLRPLVRSVPSNPNPSQNSISVPQSITTNIENCAHRLKIVRGASGQANDVHLLYPTRISRVGTLGFQFTFSESALRGAGFSLLRPNAPTPPNNGNTSGAVVGGMGGGPVGGMGMGPGGSTIINNMPTLIFAPISDFMIDVNNTSKVVSLVHADHFQFQGGTFLPLELLRIGGNNVLSLQIEHSCQSIPVTPVPVTGSVKK